MADLPVLDWFMEIGPVTRTYCAMSVLTSLMVQCGVVSEFQLYFSPRAVWSMGQYWRVVTTFLYFGKIQLDFLFHMFFIMRYSRMLEESDFRHKTADFLWLYIVCGAMLLAISSPIHAFTIPFLGSPLSFAIVYVWSRRNSTIQINFFGVFILSAAYLPAVLAGISWMLNNRVPIGDVLGAIAGHTYWFLEDVWPRSRHGRRFLQTPSFLTRIVEGPRPWTRAPVPEPAN